MSLAAVFPSKSYICFEVSFDLVVYDLCRAPFCKANSLREVPADKIVIENVCFGFIHHSDSSFLVVPDLVSSDVRLCSFSLDQNSMVGASFDKVIAYNRSAVSHFSLGRLNSEYFLAKNLNPAFLALENLVLSNLTDVVHHFYSNIVVVHFVSFYYSVRAVINLDCG